MISEKDVPVKIRQCLFHSRIKEKKKKEPVVNIKQSWNKRTTNLAPTENLSLSFCNDQKKITFETGFPKLLPRNFERGTTFGFC